MSRSGPITLAIALVAGLGCGGDEPVDPSIAALAIGSAATDGSGFVEVADGATVELVPGSQGGFHVWTGIRVRGASGELFLRRKARRVSDGTLVLTTGDQYMLVDETDLEGWWERPDAAASFMCPAPVGVRIYGTELAFTAELIDGDDKLLADAHLVLTPVCPTGDQEAFCLRVCDG